MAYHGQSSQPSLLASSQHAPSSYAGAGAGAGDAGYATDDGGVTDDFQSFAPSSVGHDSRYAVTVPGTPGAGGKAWMGAGAGASMSTLSASKAYDDAREFAPAQAGTPALQSTPPIPSSSQLRYHDDGVYPPTVGEQRREAAAALHRRDAPLPAPPGGEAFPGASADSAASYPFPQAHPYGAEATAPMEPVQDGGYASYAYPQPHLYQGAGAPATSPLGGSLSQGPGGLAPVQTASDGEGVIGERGLGKGQTTARIMRDRTLFLTVIIVEAIIVIVMIAIVFASLNANVKSYYQNLKTIPVYLAVFILAMLFEVGIALDAVRLKNTIQNIGICLFNCAMLVYAALQVSEVRTALETTAGVPQLGPGVGEAHHCWTDKHLTCYAFDGLYDNLRRFLIVVPVILGVAQIFIMFFSYRLWGDFGWAIYKKIGADLAIKRMYLWYEVYVVLLKMDVFFGIGYVMQLLILIPIDSSELALTIAAVPVCCVLLICAGIAVRGEIKSLMLLTQLGLLAGLAYFIYKLERMYDPSTSREYVATQITLTVFAAFSIFLLLLTFINSVVCFLNFGKGLREAHQSVGRVNASGLGRRQSEEKLGRFGRKDGALDAGGAPVSGYGVGTGTGTGRTDLTGYSGQSGGGGRGTLGRTPTRLSLD